MIKIAKTKTEFEKINNFFWKIWKKEFDLDRFDKIEEYKSGKVYFLEENSKIISAIFLYEKKYQIHIWRFATLEEQRWKKLATKLFWEVIKKIKNKKIILNADYKKKWFYEKLWFIITWKKLEIWNTIALEMIYKW